MGLFADPIQANSLLDRLCHNAHQIEWEGESYRKRKRRNFSISPGRLPGSAARLASAKG